MLSPRAAVPVRRVALVGLVASALAVCGLGVDTSADAAGSTPTVTTFADLQSAFAAATSTPSTVTIGADIDGTSDAVPDLVLPPGAVLTVQMSEHQVKATHVVLGVGSTLSVVGTTDPATPTDNPGGYLQANAPDGRPGIRTTKATLVVDDAYVSAGSTGTTSAGSVSAGVGGDGNEVGTPLGSDGGTVVVEGRGDIEAGSVGGAGIGGGAGGSGGSLTVGDESGADGYGTAGGAGVGSGPALPGQPVPTGGAVHVNGDAQVNGEVDDSGAAAVGGGTGASGADVVVGPDATLFSVFEGDPTGSTSTGIGAGVGGPTFGSLDNQGQTVVIAPRLDVPQGATVTNEGLIQLYGETALTGDGTITNDGDIASPLSVEERDGTGHGLLITHDNYTLSFDSTDGFADQHVYARTAHASGAGLPVSADVCPDGQSPIGWTTAGGTAVGSRTNLPGALGQGPASVTLTPRCGTPAVLAPITPPEGGTYYHLQLGVPVAIPLSATGTAPVVLATDNTDVGDPDPTHVMPGLTLADHGDGTATITGHPTEVGYWTSTFVADNGAEPASSRTVTFQVVQAATSLSVSVGADELTAAVHTDAVGIVPTGSVDFTVAGVDVGTAPIVNGVATLPYSISTGQAKQVAASYAGDDDFTGSSDSTAATGLDPLLAATVTSTRPRTASGWYRAPVTIRYTCTPRGGRIVPACPSPLVLRSDVVGQSITQAVASTNGGIASVVTGPIDLDQTPPSVQLTGVVAGHTYAKAPTAVCHATDATSGVASCRVAHAKHGSRVTYTATAADKAGNTATTSVTVVLKKKAKRH